MVETTLNKFGIEYNSHVIRDLIESNEKAKTQLNSVFANMPTWDANNSRFSLDVERVIEPDFYNARHQVINILDVFRYDIINQSENTRLFSQIYELTYFIENKIIGEYFSEKIKELWNLKINKNLKTTSAIRKVLDKLIDLYPNCYNEYKREIDRHYARFCDYMTEKKEARQVYFSTSLNDFLLMSDGNSWRSCHYLKDGRYRTGTLSYALDETTFLAFELNSEGKKIFRQCIHTSEEDLIQSRAYGDLPYDLQLAIGKALFKALGREGRILTEYDVSSYFKTCYASLHFPDYHYYDVIPYSIDLPLVYSEGKGIIGSPAPCLQCGDMNSQEDDFNCCDCTNLYICPHCRDQVDINDTYWVNDERFCSDCVSYCESCNEYFLTDDMQQHRVGYRTEYYCDSCYWDNFSECEHCGEIVPIDDIREHEDSYYCNSCYDELEIDSDEK